MLKTKAFRSSTVIMVLLVILLFAVPTATVSQNSSAKIFTPSSSTNNTSTSQAFYLAVDSYGSFTPDLNPFSGIASAPYETTALSLIYQPLMYLMNGESPVPAVASSYHYSANLTNLTFTIKTGLRYSNGQPLNASDVLFTFNYILSNSVIDTHGLSSFVKGVAMTGPNMISFYLKNTQYTDLYNIMSQPIIYPPQWKGVSNPGGITLTNPIGSGPFMATSITSSEFVLKWNPYYNYTGKHLSEIIIPSYPTVTAEANALASGNINWLSGAFDADAPTWATQSPYHFYFTPPSGFLMLYLNNLKWPLSNPDVRAAIAYAVNRQVLSNESLQPPAGNYIMPALSNYFEPGFLASHPNGTYYNYNLTYATELMEKGGFTLKNGYWTASNGTVVSLTLSGNGAASNVVANLNTMEQELNNFGIKTNVYTPSGAIFYANVYDGNYSAGLAYLPSSINPIGALNTSFSYYWYKPIGVAANGDYSRFNNTTFEQYITEAASQPNITMQRYYIAKALSILYNLTPSVPIAMTISQNEFNTYGFAGINETSFKDALYANSFGLVSIAVPLTTVYSTTSTTSTSPISPLEIGIIAVIIVIVAAAAFLVNRRKKA
ncbi:ABC transporter substrate-binding protein [Thermoplasma sp.]|uniref:ABC transporter substrate-binding protein n=1 Tax=Thermoplasma sp. TaxID=1973142 RepID=UPI0026049D8C|nr:ABC transporter substrate-binding protein [Thermoplasma sp.]